MSIRACIAFMIVIFSASGCSQSGMTKNEDDGVYLSDMKESLVFNIHGGLGRDATYWGFPIQVNGVRYTKAIVTHPEESPGFVEYDLNAQYSQLLALIAIRDDSGESGANHGNAVFEVELDSRKVYRSGILQWNRKNSQNIELDVRGAKKLRLWVNCANYSNYSDHAVWINARLLK